MATKSFNQTLGYLASNKFWLYFGAFHQTFSGNTEFVVKAIKIEVQTDW